ncbi:uncharacterized protein LOC109826540 [Asparagus officinalis]|uniref:uncharacterized protein LOC109826540 n=1 Tax=Asparagus officinalis TaxID=4686 RepID=UPI00098E6B9A|nr:uncharacterized protein LOC109826540 [Asparagus officinalis]
MAGETTLKAVLLVEFSEDDDATLYVISKRPQTTAEWSEAGASIAYILENIAASYSHPRNSLRRSLHPPFSYGELSTPSEATSDVAPPQIVDLEDDVDTRTEEEILEDMKNNESHVKICKRYPPNVEMLNKERQKILVFKNKEELKAVGCSQQGITEGCVHMIVVDELPFRFVEGEGFKYFCKRACPYWVIPCRQTIAKHVLSMYKSEKKILKDALKGKRVSLTTDTWASIQNINYMVLTAYFVEDDWILHKKVLNFCVIPNDKGESIARLLEECLTE